MEDPINNYPKSKNKFQCLGPCYYPGTMVVHPTQLEMVTNYVQPFCPVDEWKQVDKTGKTIDTITDVCYNPTANANISGKEMELNILTPFIDFNCEQFLKIYYDIFSFEDSIEWICVNAHVPIDTKTRIISSALNAFGETVDIFDNRFVDYIVEYVKKYVMSDIYGKIHMYIGEKDNLIQIVKNHNLQHDDMIVERYNYITKVFINNVEISKFLSKYFKHRKSQWKTINNHIINIAYDLIEYIYHKLNLSI